MIYQKSIFILNLFFIIINEIYSSYLIFPFKTRITKIENSENNITLLFRSLQDNNIYINMDVGKPRQTIEFFLRSDSEIIYISEKNKTDLNPSYNNPIIYDVNSDINKFFDKNKSTTLNISSQSLSVFNDIGKYSDDIMYFKTNKNQIELRTSFGLLKSTRGNMPGVIGLKLLKYEQYRPYNLLAQLKSIDAINSYYWMIDYTSDYEGNLIIGEQPHIFDPQRFKEENLINAYTFVYRTITEWGLRFDDITFQNSNFRPFLECLFKYDLNFIYGIDNFEKELDKYFNESIINGTCFKEKVKYPYSPHTFFYCNKEKYKDKVRDFPPLIFEHKELNYTFELNYKDLFIEKYDKLILLVFFDDYGLDWKLGKPFLRKYSFLMNPDSKAVGFYGKNNLDYKYNKDDTDSFEVKKILKIVFIIIAVAILLILGIFIGKYYFKERKKRINAIDDDYEYKTDNDDKFISKIEAENIN